MFFSVGSLQLDQAFFRTHVAVDRGLRVFAAERRGVTFRTRFVPASRAPKRNVVVLWFIVSGWAAWEGQNEVAGNRRRAHGKTLVLLSESAFDGAEGKREFQLVSSGQPFVGIEVRLPGTLAMGDASRGPVVLTASEAAWAAVERYIARVLVPGRTTSAAFVLELLGELAKEGLVKPEAANLVVTDEDPRMTHIWDATAEAYERFDTRPTLKRVADACDMSLRNLSRFIDLAYNDLLLPSAGWREMSTNLRLMIAILFLSCPSLSIAQVADAVGYGHAQAMANAFKRAGVPAPRDIQAYRDDTFT
ncbi:MAG: hypothetical protein U0174_12435 [Polyangiaceae bacterium]